MGQDQTLEKYFDENPEKAREIGESIVKDQKEKQNERDGLKEHGPTLWLPPNPEWAENREIPYWLIIVIFIVIPGTILLFLIINLTT